MPITLTAMRSLLRPEGWPLHLALGAIIAVAYPWHPLYSGNQNVYLVHALARTIMPGLQSDPIFLQPDPFPLFTWLSMALIHVHPLCMHVAYALLCGVYVHALFGLVQTLVPKALEDARLLPFCTLFVILHTNELWGTLLRSLAGIDLRWFFDSGMAEQGVLRGYWQPSVFGVFLLLGFSLWFEGNKVAALAAVAVAGAFHANYLLLGGCIGTVILLRSIMEGNFREAMSGAIVAAVIVAPSVYLTFRDFVLIDPEKAADVALAARQLAIGHVHFDPHQWLNAKTISQSMLFIIFIFLFRDDKRLRPTFLIAAVALVASIVALRLPGSTLHSLAPWRMSVVLFPMAFTLILARWFSFQRPDLLLNLAVQRPNSFSRPVMSDKILPVSPSYFSSILFVFFSFLIEIIALRLFSAAGRSHIWQGVAVIIMAVAAVTSFMSFMRRSRLIKSIAIGCIVLSAASGALSHMLELHNLEATEQYAVARALRATGESGLVLAPPKFTLLRLASGYPMLIDANLHHSPVLGDRLRLLRAIEVTYAADTFNLDIASGHPEVNILIIPKKKMPAGLTDWHLSASTADHAILSR